jgi:hypothetical protein
MATGDLVASALAELAGTRYHRSDAVELVANSAGLYAFYGDHLAWSDLVLTPAFVSQPLTSERQSEV